MKTWVIVLWIMVIGYWFHYVNTLNYMKEKQIQSLYVNHPEMLPTSEAAEASSFGFRNVIADLYWLQAIQYIGSNAIDGEYKKYLWAMMQIITDLNPYFESPYVIGELLLPSNDGVGWKFSESKNQDNILQWEALGLKGVKNFCDSDKIDLIFKENDLEKIQNDPQFKNPCKSYKIPYYLAYIYYFYMQDGTTSSQYYKVVAAQEDAPSWAKVLAAIMQWKGWEREKSIFMFLSLAKSLWSSEDSCTFMTQKINDAYNYITQENLPISAEMVAAIEADSKLVLPVLTEENENDILDDTQCTNYLVKAIREINLLYIEQADAQYVKDNPEEESAQRTQKLFDEKYIQFIPTDYQQYSDADYGIIYKYNDEIGRFDYEMWY